MAEAKPNKDVRGETREPFLKDRTSGSETDKRKDISGLDEVGAKALRTIATAVPEDPQGEKLSPEQIATLAILRTNQEAKEAKLQTGIEWAEVEAKLRQNPEKLTVLTRLIQRGGEPTVTARLSNGNFRFDELSEESPSGNRDVDFDNAERIAGELGAELTGIEVYNSFRSKGIVLDQTSWSWLRTSKYLRKTGVFFGSGGYSYYYDNANVHNQHGGLRCSLEV